MEHIERTICQVAGSMVDQKQTETGPQNTLYLTVLNSPAQKDLTAYAVSPRVNSDESRAGSDKSRAGSDKSRAGSDESRAGSDESRVDNARDDDADCIKPV
jgi:hypothetical protein